MAEPFDLRTLVMEALTLAALQARSKQRQYESVVGVWDVRWNCYSQMRDFPRFTSVCALLYLTRTAIVTGGRLEGAALRVV